MKYTYTIENFYLDKWVKILSDTRDFCLGYMTASKYEAPRLAMRLMRSDGKIMHEHDAQTEVNIGQIAGWPTPEQYEFAAKLALDKAARIREQQAKQDARRNP